MKNHKELTTTEKINYMYNFLRQNADIPLVYLNALHKECLEHTYKPLPDSPYTAYGELRRLFFKYT